MCMWISVCMHMGYMRVDKRGCIRVDKCTFWGRPTGIPIKLSTGLVAPLVLRRIMKGRVFLLCECLGKGRGVRGGDTQERDVFGRVWVS